MAYSMSEAGSDWETWKVLDVNTAKPLADELKWVDATAIGVDDAVAADYEAEGRGVTATRPNLVASFSAEDAVALRTGERMPLAIDTAHIHLFDAETGAPLR